MKCIRQLKANSYSAGKVVIPITNHMTHVNSIIRPPYSLCFIFSECLFFLSFNIRINVTYALLPQPCDSIAQTDSCVYYVPLFCLTYFGLL